MSDVTTQERIHVSESHGTANGRAPGERSFLQRKYQQEIAQLDDDIEGDSAAIVRLLQTCGWSENFGPAQQKQFEELLIRRRKLLADLERVRLESGLPK